jgi:hypothetical protein
MIAPPNGHFDTPQTPAPRAAAPVPEAVQHLFTQVVAVLEKGDREEAVRQFLHGAAHGLWRDDAPLTQWLTQVVGKDRAARVIEALAVQPCFYCQHGYALCEACGGSRRSTMGGVCDVCLGLGQAFCDFCNGSGWAAIDFVPAGLRRAVVLARVRLAIAKIRTLLDQPLPAADAPDLQQAGHASAALLAALNRNMGVLENAIVALKESIPAKLVTPETTAKVTEACTRAAPLLDERIRQVLGVMAQVARRQGLNTSTEAAQEDANRAAAFYERLAADSFGQTKLEHPFIHRTK